MKRLTVSLVLISSLAMFNTAHAEDGAWSHSLVYTADVIGPVSGAKRAGRYLDNLDATLDGDLDKAIGWRGARVHAYVLNNAGGRPNEIAGTLQGVDNIEVSSAKTRLYELWIEQALADGRASLRAGLYDLNSEFYTTEASDLLLAPPFGIGSELAATGPNGPSIFPLTSLAVRLRVGGDTGTYGQAAVLSAEAGALNGPGPMQFGLDRGAILIGEVGHAGRARVAAGAWTYTEKQDGIRTRDPAGRYSAQGAYVLAEGRIAGEDGGPSTRAFLRAGVSDGKTTPFAGGWQAGLRWDQVLPGRPDSQASIGVHQGRLSGPYRADGRAGGLDLARSESGLEVTVSDRFGRLSVQPDLQVFRRPEGLRGRKTLVVAGVRFTVDLD